MLKHTVESVLILITKWGEVRYCYTANMRAAVR